MKIYAAFWFFLVLTMVPAIGSATQSSSDPDYIFSTKCKFGGVVEDLVESCTEILSQSSPTIAQRARLYEIIASAYYEELNYERALENWNKALAIDPTSKSALWRRANLHLLNGQHANALNDFESSWQDNPTTLQFLGRGSARLGIGDYSGSIEDFTNILAKQPDYYDALFGRAKAYHASRRFELALTDLNKLISANSSVAELYAGRADIFGSYKQYDRAIADLDAYIKLRPDVALAYQSRGEFQAKANNLVRAVADFNEAVRLEPGNVSALIERGDTHALLGNRDQAYADFSKVIQYEKNQARAFVGRANIHGLRNEYVLALSDIAVAIRLDPQFIDAWFERCVIRTNTGRDLPDALYDCDQAVSLDPSNARIRDGRAATLIKLFKFAAAFSDSDFAVKADPDNANYLYGRGISLLKLGKTAEGYADLAKATALDPNIAAMYASVGIVP